MNPQSNATPETSVAPRPARSSVRPLYWSIRRELWEVRSIYLAPVAVAGVFLLGFLFYLHKLPESARAALPPQAVEQREALVQPFDYAAASIMGIAFIVGLLYSLEALYGERRDRSILFWKSLPISDRTTVLAKASIPFVVVPSVTFAIGVTTHFIMLLVSSAILLGSGASVAALWRSISFFRMSLLLLYHIFTAHALWPAPI